MGDDVQDRETDAAPAGRTAWATTKWRVRKAIRFGCVVPLFSRDDHQRTERRTQRGARVYSPRFGATHAGKPIQVAIALDNSMAWGKITDLKSQLVREKVHLEDEIRSLMHFREIVGKTKALREILQQVEVVAPTDSTVLIYGETGTGKEAIARAIHDLSGEKSQSLRQAELCRAPDGPDGEPSYSAMKRARSPGPSRQRIGRFGSSRTAGACFWTRWVRSPLEFYSRNSCGCSRNANSSGSVAARRSGPMRG